MRAGIPVSGTPVFYLSPHMSRVAIFIDGGYLTKLLKELGEPSLDYLRFSELLASGKERLRTYYYHCMPYRSNPPTGEENERYAGMQRFVEYLRRLPRFEVRLGRLAKRDKQCGQCRQEWSEFEQKRVDVLFAADLMPLAASQQIGRMEAGITDHVWEMGELLDA